MATAATQSPRLTSDCSSTSASPEPAAPIVQSAYRPRAEPGSRSGSKGELVGSDPPGQLTNGDEDTDAYEEFDEEPKSDYSSEHEPLGVN